jgi:hypothetical protein
LTVQTPFTGIGAQRCQPFEDADGETRMTSFPRLTRPLLLALGTAVMLAGCTPTIRLQVDPIQIYAKLDADVRVRLDQELRDLLTENPNLF